MLHVTIRPNFKTAGGEVGDIMLGDVRVGTLTFVYRENDRIAGSVQLEQESLSGREKRQVIRYLRSHVQALIDALRARFCDVVVTCSVYDTVIATSGPARDARRLAPHSTDVEKDFDYDCDWVEEDSRLEDFDPEERDSLEMRNAHGSFAEQKPAQDGPDPEADGRRDPGSYRLALTREGRHGMEYHVYDGDEEWVAEVFVQVRGREVTGTVSWLFDPTDEDIERAAELVVNEFDDNQVDTFQLEMKYEGERIETIELTHRDVLGASRDGARKKARAGRYRVVLARDDGDMLTYEIFKEEADSLPIGTATVDISQRQLSGFMDFQEPVVTEEAERIGALLMRELDKEKEFETINLTVLYKNEPIDEMRLEAGQLH